MTVMTPRMLERKFIDRAGRMVNTQPERDFQAFVDAHSLPYKMNEARQFMARDRRGVLRTFNFQLDFVEFADPEVFREWKVTGFVRSDARVKTDFEVDGKGHKDSSDPWKDAAKNAAGVKVVHIPSFMCRRRMWTGLLESLRTALRQPELTVYLDGYGR